MQQDSNKELNTLQMQHVVQRLLQIRNPPQAVTNSQSKPTEGNFDETQKYYRAIRNSCPNIR